MRFHTLKLCDFQFLIQKIASKLIGQEYSGKLLEKCQLDVSLQEIDKFYDLFYDLMESVIDAFKRR